MQLIQLLVRHLLIFDIGTDYPLVPPDGLTLRPNSQSCRTVSIRSGIAGGLAGEFAAAVGGPPTIVSHVTARSRTGSQQAIMASEVVTSPKNCSMLCRVDSCSRSLKAAVQSLVKTT